MRKPPIRIPPFSLRLAALVIISIHESVTTLFEGCKFNRAMKFVSYLRKHCLRIPEYSYFRQVGLTIGSGTVES